MHILQIGDSVTWGADRIGRIRYFTEDGTAAFVKALPVRGAAGEIERVPIDELTSLEPEAATS